MVPYGHIGFFVIAGFFAILIFVAGSLFKKNTLLQGLVVLYCLLFFAFVFDFSKLKVLLIYFACTYFLLYLFTHPLKKTHGLVVCLVLLLPLIAVKLQPVWINAPIDLGLFAFMGLSFVTFRVIQFYLDFDLIKKFPDPVKFFVYLFNPAWIMIGPIDTYQRFNQNWTNISRNITNETTAKSLDHIVLGLLQNMVLARLVNEFVLMPLEAEPMSFQKFYFQMFGYMAYLYFDFAGYSNMAQGFSGLLGLPVPSNFNNPFIARNPQDFWKRWHITLSEWLGNYFFKPYYKWINSFQALKSWPRFKQNSGLFLTFVIMGAWNGFSRNYLQSGILFGLYSVVHNSYLQQCRKKGRDVVFNGWNPTLVHVFSVILMLHLNAFAIYLFSGLLMPYLG